MEYYITTDISSTEEIYLRCGPKDSLSSGICSVASSLTDPIPIYFPREWYF